MDRGIILGGGTAGIITSLFTGHRIVDNNPLGELNLPFIPGIRIFKWEKDVVKFISFWLSETNTSFKIEKKTLNIGYSKPNYLVNPYLTEEFKQEYSFITRGKREYEQSFLSSGQSSISYVDINDLGYEKSYKYFFEQMLKYLESQDKIVRSKIIEVLIPDRQITLEDGSAIKFSNCYSTLKLPVLEKLSGLSLNNDYSVKTKCFYKCKATNITDFKRQLDERDSKIEFAYIYSTSGVWTRKTKFEDHVVYESTSVLETDEIEGNEILHRIENIPLQIKHSISTKNFFGIELVGRYAEWNHSIKANQIIERFAERLKNKLNG